MDMSDNPDQGPLSIDEYLDTMEAPEKGQAEAEPDKAETPEAEPEEVEAEAEATEEEAGTDDQDEPTTEDEDGPETYSVEEYGEISVSLADGTQTTLKDLADGNLRRADYTRKTTELSEERKAFEAEKEALAERERQLKEQFANLEEPEPDWKALADEDPLGWQIQHIEWQKKQAQKEAAKVEAQKAEEAKRQQFMRATSAKAVEVFPEWAEPEKFNAGDNARKKAAMSVGFTEAEYNGAIDFRLAALLEKAARYDAGQQKVSSAQKKLAKVPKVVKPGASVTKAEKEQAARAAKAKLRDKPMSVDEYLATFENPG